MPELRIVEDELWQAVKQRQRSSPSRSAGTRPGNALNRAHRRRFLLSGLLVCGCCGGGYTIMGKDRYGCAAHRSKGTCGNDRTISRAGDREAGCWTGSSIACWRPSCSRRSPAPTRRRCEPGRAADGAGRGLEGRLAQVERKIAAMIRAIEDGLYQPSMKERMTALEAEKAQLTAELRPSRDTAPVALHPNLPALYRRKVEELEAVLADPELGPEAMEAIRPMITRIVLTPRAEGGMEAVLEGDLARILTICAGAERTNARRVSGGRSADVLGRQVSVVAGAGFEPATFRL